MRTLKKAELEKAFIALSKENEKTKKLLRVKNKNNRYFIVFTFYTLRQ